MLWMYGIERWKTKMQEKSLSGETNMIFCREWVDDVQRVKIFGVRLYHHLKRVLRVIHDFVKHGEWR